MPNVQNYRFAIISKLAVLALSLLAFPIVSSAQGGGILEEIVVTATKRAKTLQEIPIAVTVTSADTIEKANIQDIKDLQSLVPSLRVSQLQNSTNTNFVIRGFGNGANNPGIEPSVGIFIDGVYRSRAAASISDLPNIQRVEVLRGPQSTLFGKNASAGVISVITRKPTGEAASRISASVGNFGALTFKAQTEGALSDNVAYDIAVSHNESDGYFKNNVTGNDINSRDRNSIRGQLVFNPSDRTEVRIIADFDQIDEECCGVINILEGALGAFTIPFSGGQIVANDRNALNAFYNIDPLNEVDNSGISAHVDVDYDSFTLTSITSLRNVDSRSLVDTDFTSSALITTELDTQIDTFTQEIRLTSNGDGAVDWMVGGFYFDESIDYFDDLIFGAGFRPFLDATVLALGGSLNSLAGIEVALGLPPFQAFGQPGQGHRIDATLDNDAISLFGTVDWHINDRLTATLGLNYTKDEKQVSLSQSRADLLSQIDFVQLGGALIFQTLVGAGVPPAIAAQQAGALSTTAANPLLGLQPVQFLPDIVVLPNAVENGKTDDDDLTYSLRLAYDVSDSVSVYGGISTGFKASSWNLSRNSAPNPGDVGAVAAAGLGVTNQAAGTRLAGPEEAEVIELGLKARFDRGSVNIAIFDQNIKGFQSNTFIGAAFVLSNAGKQSTTGIEFDGVYYPSDALKLTLAVTLLDPKFDDFKGGLGPNGPADLSGTTPGGIHETSISLGALYKFQIGNSEAYIGGDFQFDDNIPTNTAILASIGSREVKNLNLSAGLTTESGLSLSIWGRNVTDHETLITAFPSVAQNGSFSGYRTAPRTYGITVSKDF